MDDSLLIDYQEVEIYREELLILQQVDLQVHQGEFIYIIGKVGAGKSTLLKTMYAEVPITAGEAYLFQYDLRKIKRKQIPALRRKLGIVFQDFQLLNRSKCI
jgi:cell division transport system ATP-binding protein